MRNNGPPSKNFEDHTGASKQLQDLYVAPWRYHRENTGPIGPEKLTPEERIAPKKNGWTVEDILVLRTMKNNLPNIGTRHPDK